jgi:AcrR family transcriptional regulator
MTEERNGADRRRMAILDAAELNFVRRGFHRTTMQDVAAEAGMSPGNLYRYFPSKEAIVEGLTERERAKFMADFEALEHAPPSIALLEEIARGYLLHEPRDKKIMDLEIWAESTRNPALTTLCQSVQREVDNHLVRYLERLRDAGLAAPGIDPRRVLDTVSLMVDGLALRIATDPDCDTEARLEMVLTVFRAALAGEIHSCLSKKVSA